MKMLLQGMRGAMVLILAAGVGYSQEKGNEKGNGDFNVPGKKDDDKKDVAPATPKNLDPKNIEVTALYLNRVALKLQLLEAEATRTGNTIKYNEFNETVREELEKWNGVKVRWLAQVESVSGDKNGGGGGNFADGGALGFPITPVSAYLFKNKAKLNFTFRAPLIRPAGEEAEPLRYDREWAKTLRRMDYMIVEGKIVSTSVAGIPSIAVEPTHISKYTTTPRK